ncbi:MAG: hypothetical protein LBG79_00250 [Spirochaetaceae bacterium]|jgi:LAS superfamily LD-carboxypeptidase LdcB|nr:hypothetical protein [Spirochaetaceae bacterium]
MKKIVILLMVFALWSCAKNQAAEKIETPAIIENTENAAGTNGGTALTPAASVMETKTEAGTAPALPGVKPASPAMPSASEENKKDEDETGLDEKLAKKRQEVQKTIFESESAAKLKTPSEKAAGALSAMDDAF